VPRVNYVTKLVNLTLFISEDRTEEEKGKSPLRKAVYALRDYFRAEAIMRIRCSIDRSVLSWSGNLKVLRTLCDHVWINLFINFLLPTKMLSVEGRQKFRALCRPVTTSLCGLFVEQTAAHARATSTSGPRLCSWPFSELGHWNTFVRSVSCHDVHPPKINTDCKSLEMILSWEKSYTEIDVGLPPKKKKKKKKT